MVPTPLLSESLATLSESEFKAARAAGTRPHLKEDAIAREMGISPRTLAHQLSAVRAKLHLPPGRGALVRLAFDAGLLEPDVSRWRQS